MTDSQASSSRIRKKVVAFVVNSLSLRKTLPVCRNIQIKAQVVKCVTQTSSPQAVENDAYLSFT